MLVLLTFQLIMMTTTATIHWVEILAKFWHVGDNFGQIFKLLNIISDQFMDWNAIIDHYTHITVHKLDRNYI